MDTAGISAFLESVCRESDHPTARFWRDYWLATGHIHRLNQMIERMEPLLQSRPALLDIGGFGELLLILWKFAGLTSLRGVSLEGNCIGYRNGRLLPADDPTSEFTIYIDQCDLERQRLQLEDSTFDLVTCFEMLEHLRFDPIFMMLEIHRVLRPGGLLLLTTPNSSGWESLARAAEFDTPLMFSSYFADGSGIGHCKEYSVNELRQFVQNAGFSIEEFDTFDTIPPPAGLTERHTPLLRYLETQDWWKPELRKQSHLVLARKASSPRMRMYRPLYTEDFTFAEAKSPAENTRVVPSEIGGAVQQLDEKLRLSTYITRLQDEIESRTRWALSLEKSEREHRDALAKLSAEFDQRGRWALSLDQEVRNQREHIAALEKKLAEREQQIEKLGRIARQSFRSILKRVTGRLSTK